MDINKVWLSGTVTTEPVFTRLSSKTPLTVFSLKVNERFFDRNNVQQIRPNTFRIESLGKNAEKVLSQVHQGSRFTVDGYLRSEIIDNMEIVKVRTFAVYPDESTDTLSYKEGLKQALEILRKSRDIETAKANLEVLIK